MNVFLICLLFLTIGCSNNNPTDKSTDKLKEVIAEFNNGMVEGNRDILEKFTSPHLNYGHSTGNIEDQETFIESLVSGKYQFNDIEISDQTIEVIEELAIVRHHLDINEVMEDKTTRDVSINVLLVFRKEQGIWKLLARQAYK